MGSYYPDNSIQLTPSGTISLGTIRSQWGLYPATSSISLGDLRTDFITASTRKNWYNGGGGYWLSTNISSSGSSSLSSFRNVSVRPWFKYTNGSWTVAAGDDIGLPFNDPVNGETIYGFSSYGFRSSTSAGLTFGSISDPKGFYTSGLLFAEIRQIIYRPGTDNGQLWIRLSDLLNSTVPPESLLSTGVSVWYSNANPGTAPGGALFYSSSSDTTYEKTRIYYMGNNWNGYSGFGSGQKGLLFGNANS